MDARDPTGGSVRRHTEAYTARWGRHPYTDCWPWAEAMTRWWQGPGPGEYVVVKPREAVCLPAALAETLRLSMARQPHRLLAELDVGMAARELGHWVRHGSTYPDPGTPGWPAPEGHREQWEELFASADGAQLRRLASACFYLLESVESRVARGPRAAAMRYRLETYGITYTHVADTAPVLGVEGPVYVTDLLAYQGMGIADLRQVDPAVS